MPRVERLFLKKEKKGGTGTKKGAAKADTRGCCKGISPRLLLMKQLYMFSSDRCWQSGINIFWIFGIYLCNLTRRGPWRNTCLAWPGLWPSAA